MKRFLLEKSRRQAGWWVLTDTENLVVLRFEEHRFNDTQQISLLNESRLIGQPDAAMIVARIMREMADYMSTHWYSIAMPVPVYEFRQDESGKRLLLIRNKHPKLTIEIKDECTHAQLASALHKAAEFISKRNHKT